LNKYPEIWWGDKSAIVDYLEKSPYEQYVIMTKDTYLE